MSSARPTFRPLSPDDQEFLFDMLYEAIYVPPGSPAAERSILELPEIRKYAASWGSQKGDWGILLSLEGKPAGALWLRFFSKENPGYGYVADDIPELSMALLPGYRGQGLGSALLRKLLADLPGYIQKISLSVDSDNPAIHLYKKFNFNISGETGASMTMVLDMKIREFWETFLNQGKNREKYAGKNYEAWHFCDNKKDADELSDLVLKGIKRGTASLLKAYEIEGEPLPQPGEISIITDWSGSPQCIIETVKIDSYPFSEVPPSFAATEGEGDGSLAYWRKAHIAAFSREAAELNIAFNEKSIVICEEFRLVYPISVWTEL